MFHVKHFGPDPGSAYSIHRLYPSDSALFHRFVNSRKRSLTTSIQGYCAGGSLADAEAGKQAVEHVLDIHTPGNLADSASGEPHLFSRQFKRTMADKHGVGSL